MSNVSDSEDLYTLLRASLLERARDKDSNVRLQAIIALARLQRGEEGSGDVPDDQENLTDFLIDILQYDPMPYVSTRNSPLFCPQEATL